MKHSSRFFFLMIFCIIFAGGGTIAALSQYMKDDGHKTISSDINKHIPGYDFLSVFESYESYDPPRLPPVLKITDMNGQDSFLKDFKGKWRLLNFWASWCPPCIEEMPGLMTLHNQQKHKNFEVVLISVDSYVGSQPIKEWMQKADILGMFNSFYVNDSGLWNKLGIPGVPSSFIIDPEGLLRFKLVGERDWSDQDTLNFFDDLLDN